MSDEQLFAGPQSIRTRNERRTALSLIVTVPVSIAVIGAVFHGITPTQIALLFVGGMVFVSLARGRLLGSSIRVRREEFPEIVELVERAAARLGITAPSIFIRDDYLIPANSIGLGEPYALVLSSQYLQLMDRDELAFVIGRELGHIAAGNTRLLSLINASGRGNAIVTSLFGGWIRQTEFTADRAGLICSSLPAAIKAIAVTTFHASGRRVEAAMLHDQRRDIENDLILRLGEFTAPMPYATNRVRALETFAASDLCRAWSRRLDLAPLPVRAALGPEDGPVDRREVATALRRWLALGIDLVLLAVIFHAVRTTTGNDDAIAHGATQSFRLFGHVFHTRFSELDLQTVANRLGENAWIYYFPYAAALVALTGRTLGMMVLDLRVVGRNHERVGIAQAIWRYVVALGCTITFVPLMLTFFRRIQWQDRWSRSFLVGNRLR